MIDPNDCETWAFGKASEAGGAFVEGAGGTDMAKWSPELWDAFIQAVVTGYVDAILQRQAEAIAAVNKVRTV